MATIIEPEGVACGRPFASTDERITFDNRNCCLCAKADWESGTDEMPCDIQAQISLASLCGGKVPLSIMERMGWQGFRPWTCKEIAPKDEQAAIELKQRDDVNQRKLFTARRA